MPTLPHSPEPSPLDALRTFRALAAPHRFRVIRDAEGWPVIPGRLGRIEWHCDGVDCHGCPEPGVLLAVYTDRPRLFGKLWAVPGVRRWQTGDREMRALFPPEALDQVAGVIRARRRRTLSPEAARQKGAGTAYRAIFRGVGAPAGARGWVRGRVRGGTPPSTASRRCPMCRALVFGLVVILVAACATRPPASPERLAELRAKANACHRELPSDLRYEIDRFGTLRVTGRTSAGALPTPTKFYDCVFGAGRWK